MAIFEGCTKVSPVVNHPPHLTRGRQYIIIHTDDTTVSVRDDCGQVMDFDHLYFEATL
jgi:hypothetical protein